MHTHAQMHTYHVPPLPPLPLAHAHTQVADELVKELSESEKRTPGSSDIVGHVVAQR